MTIYAGNFAENPGEHYVGLFPWSQTHLMEEIFINDDSSSNNLMIEDNQLTNQATTYGMTSGPAVNP